MVSPVQPPLGEGNKPTSSSRLTQARVHAVLKKALGCLAWGEAPSTGHPDGTPKSTLQHAGLSVTFTLRGKHVNQPRNNLASGSKADLGLGVPLGQQRLQSACKAGP